MKVFPELTPELSEWALQQPLFFTATAPKHGQHVNVSPKGLPSTSLAVISPNCVAYVDRTGSGCETLAHLYENGRATIMFLSFGPAPRILRLFCRRRELVERGEAPEAFEAWLARLRVPQPAGARAVIVLDVFKVTTSCGFGVPLVRRELWADSPLREVAVFQDRDTLDNYAAKVEEAGALVGYQVANNAASLDGLPGLRAARRAHPNPVRALWPVYAAAWARGVADQRAGMAVGFLAAVLLWFLLRLVPASPLGL